jgi:hypothetical protein
LLEPAPLATPSSWVDSVAASDRVLTNQLVRARQLPKLPCGEE